MGSDAAGQLEVPFSTHTLEFLIWITANRPGDKDSTWHPREEDLTLGDRLLLYFAHEGLRNVAEGLGRAVLRTRQPFVEHGLCWLAFPKDYTAAPVGSRPHFTPWTNGVGAAMLEALQAELGRRWIEVESGKERIVEPQAMRVLGLAQERVLTAFLDAVEQVGRMDLARFLLQAASVLVGPHAQAGMWTARLHMAGLRVGRSRGHVSGGDDFSADAGSSANLGTAGAASATSTRVTPPASCGRPNGSDARRSIGELHRVIVQQLDPMRQA